MTAELEDPAVRRVMLALVGVAAVALELALAEPGRPQWLCVASALAMLVAPTLAVAAYLARKCPPVGMTETTIAASGPRHRSTLRPGIVVFLLALFMLPFGGLMMQYAWLGRGMMLEVVLLAALRNLGLGLAALGHRPACARLGAVISVFLILVATSLGEGELLLALVAAYAVAGAYWLMLVYWNGLAAGECKPRRVPWSAAPWILVVVVSCAAAAVGPTRAATALVGLVPTSGGTDCNDPEARGGVNDGDNEVKGSEAPQSVGFTDSEIYLDTDRPSLYDAINEVYGMPFKPHKHERMIALGPSDVREQKERPAENLQAGREFPLVRRKPDQPIRRPGERMATALLYIKGPTPAHLALKAYDRFDGHAWREEAFREIHCPLEKDGKGAWLRLAWHTPPIYRGTATHHIKIGTLDSAPLPVPAHLARLRVGSVDRTDFFAWAQDGILRMVGRTVPAGTVIDAESRVIDPRLLSVIHPALPRHAPDRYTAPVDGNSASPAVSALARSWVEGLPRGWDQIDSVVAALREGFTLDREAGTPDGRVDVVEHFLLESRRGPDYLFASSAVMLLRSLGYPARLVSGFYADPLRYDVRTRHTPMRPEDLHVWAEVLLSGGTWIPVEPTPGYHIAVPSQTLGERVAAALATAYRLVKAHRIALGVWLVVLACGGRYRREVLDGLATLAWRRDACRALRPCVLATLGLVEKRSRWAGCPRPPGLTPSRWYGPIAIAVASESHDELNTLVRLADWFLYSPEGRSCAVPLTEQDIRTTCRLVVSKWTLGRLRDSSQSETRKAAAL